MMVSSRPRIRPKNRTPFDVLDRGAFLFCWYVVVGAGSTKMKAVMLWGDFNKRWGEGKEREVGLDGIGLNGEG